MKKVTFFDPIKNVNRDIGLKKTKKIWKTLTVIKDRQAFGVILGKEVNLEKTFWYLVTLGPLSLAFPDLTLRQNGKHHFRNYLIDVSKACKSTAPNEAGWIIDPMSVMRAIRVKKTYKELIKTVIKFTLSSGSLKTIINKVTERCVSRY